MARCLARRRPGYPPGSAPIRIHVHKRPQSVHFAPFGRPDPSHH